MDATEIAQYRDARHIFPVKREDACGLLAQSSRSLWKRDVLVYVFVLAVVGRRDLGQEPSDHLDDICDRHCADLILLSYLLLASQRVSRTVVRSCEDLFTGKALYVIQVANLDSIWGRGPGTGE